MSYPLLTKLILALALVSGVAVILMMIDVLPMAATGIFLFITFMVAMSLNLRRNDLRPKKRKWQ